MIVVCWGFFSTYLKQKITFNKTEVVLELVLVEISMSHVYKINMKMNYEVELINPNNCKGKFSHIGL